MTFSPMKIDHFYRIILKNIYFYILLKIPAIILKRKEVNFCKNLKYLIFFLHFNFCRFDIFSIFFRKIIFIFSYHIMAIICNPFTEGNCNHFHLSCIRLPSIHFACHHMFQHHLQSTTRLQTYEIPGDIHYFYFICLA